MEEEEYFLCSEGLIETIQPKEKSKYLNYFSNRVAIAKLKFKKVKKLYNTLEDDQKQFFWCQEIEDGYIDVSKFNMKKVKKQGFFNWILDTLNLSKVQNQCIIIHRVSVEEGLDPIELFNTLAEK